MSNPIAHWELMVEDAEKAKAFYAKVFDWTFDDETYPGYVMIQTGSAPGGGIMQKANGAPRSALNTYFLVDDIQQTLRNVVEAGGMVVVPRTRIPGVGWYAMFHDLDGIPVGILEAV